MAITSDDLLSPKGPITTVLFPDVAEREVGIKLDGFIAAGLADARVASFPDGALKDRKTTYFALGTAYDEVTQRMIAEPLTLNVGAEKGSHGYSTKQIEMMAALAKKYWDLFDSIQLDDAPTNPTPAKVPSINVPTEVTW